MGGPVRRCRKVWLSGGRGMRVGGKPLIPDRLAKDPAVIATGRGPGTDEVRSPLAAGAIAQPPGAARQRNGQDPPPSAA